MTIIRSLLDTDTYTFSVGMAVKVLYSGVNVRYEFINRNKSFIFSRECFSAIKNEIMSLADLSMTDDEIKWIRLNFPYLSDMYISWLSCLKLDPEKEIIITHNEDNSISLSIVGEWARVVFYEVPVMAIISECYFRYMDVDWNYCGQKEKILDKMKKLAGLTVADFGTRRRRSVKSQADLVNYAKEFPNFVGTSNALLAMLYNTKPIGTQSHQWYMGISALESLRYANRDGLQRWSDVFNGSLGIALTDTFGTDAFFQDFTGRFAREYDGVRHDSGCPFEFADRVIDHYENNGIDPSTKTIVFSDGLDVELANKIADYCGNRIRYSFGIGTSFTNSFLNSNGEQSKPMNMVIKLYEVDGIKVVKLSDNPSKTIGDKDAVRVAKWTFFDQLLDS